MDFYHYRVDWYKNCHHTFMFKQHVKVNFASDDPFKIKTILVYTCVFTAFQKRSRPHYTTENACHMTIHAGTTIVICIGRLPIIYMTDSSTCLERSNGESTRKYLWYNNEHDVIVTQSSRIRRVNVDSHAIVFKSLYFGPFTL